MKIYPLFAQRFFAYPQVRQSFTAAMHALSDRYKMRYSLWLKSANCRCLGRIHDSVLFICNAPYNPSGTGILVKVPMTRSRARRWNVADESRRLQELAMNGPKKGPFDYIVPIDESIDPPFIAYPYYYSISLREIIETSTRRKHSDENLSRALRSCSLAGNWLGQFYANSLKYLKNDSVGEFQFLEERLCEIDEFSRGRVLTKNARQLVSAARDSAKLPKSLTSLQPTATHGDFVQDNILISPTNRLCVIDPEPILTITYSDFFRFREGLILRLHARARLERSAANKYSQAFSKEFRTAYHLHEDTGVAYLKYVVAQVAHYYKSPLVKARLTPRGLLCWYDKRCIISHWGDWISSLPTEPNTLWYYIEENI